MVIRNNSENGDGPVKVTLTIGNWLTLIGLLVGWTVACAALYVKLENRLTKLETWVEYLVRDKKP